MDSVMITLKMKDKRPSQDLEVPANVPVRELEKMLVKALHLNIGETGIITGYQIHADPPGRLLEEYETLEDAGVWDGSVLMLL